MPLPPPRSPVRPPSTASVQPKAGKATGKKPTLRGARRRAGRTAADVHLSRRGALTAVAVDILARIIVDALGKQLGQSVIVENRGGAGGNIAMGVAARAKPDGYTLLLTSSVLVVNPLLYKTVPFDPAKDFVPISLLGTSPNLMVAQPAFANTMIEFIAKAKAGPGQLNYSTPGVGTKGHFAVELLKLRAGLGVTHVPYASGAQVVQSVLGGTTQLGSTALPAAEPQIRAGTLAGLAVSGAKRWPTLPDVPTIAQLG